MKKTRLVGKKLYRVGPLKCYKDNHHGHGSGGVYSSSRPQGYGSGSGQGSYMGSDRHRSSQGDAYRANQERIKKEAEAKKKEEERIKKKKLDIKKMMEEDPTAFRGMLDSPDPETAKMAAAAAQVEETKKENAAAEKIKANKKVKNALKKGALKLLGGALVNVAGLGTVTAAAAMLSDEISPEKKAAIIAKITPQFMKGEPVTASAEEIQTELASGNYENPANPNIMSGSPSTQTRQNENKGGDDFKLPEIPGQVVAKTTVEEKTEEEGPKGPGEMTEAQLTEMLEKRARGEDSIVDKESKIARERSLAQQLSGVRGARGTTAGQRLRALQRGGEEMGRKLASETGLAKAREQQAAQDALLGMKRGDRKTAEEFARKKEFAKYEKDLKGSGGGGGAPGQMSSGSKFLNKLGQGINFYKQHKDLFSFEEGGFVSGKGTETSDSIPARLSDGEFVIKASAVRGLGKSMGAEDKEEERKKGVDFLYKLQDKMDKVEKFDEGGEVKDPDMYEQRFISTLTPKQRREAALTEKFKVGREGRKRQGKEESFAFRADQDDQDKIEAIDKKYGVDRLDDEEIEKAFEKQRSSPRIQEMMEREKRIKKTGRLKEGGEVYVRPKKAFREAIGYEGESRFHDKAAKDAKFGGARRKFRHFQDGGPVDMKGPGMVKEQFKMPSAGGYGSVVAAQADLQRRLEELERKMGK